jgi:hypothetical protein
VYDDIQFGQDEFLPPPPNNSYDEDHYSLQFNLGIQAGTSEMPYYHKIIDGNFSLSKEDDSSLLSDNNINEMLVGTMFVALWKKVASRKKSKVI